MNKQVNRLSLHRNGKVFGIMMALSLLIFSSNILAAEKPNQSAVEVCFNTCPISGRVMFHRDGFTVCRCIPKKSVSYEYKHSKDPVISASLLTYKWIGLKKGTRVSGGTLKNDLYAVEAEIALLNKSDKQVSYSSPIHLIGSEDQPIWKNIQKNPIMNDPEKKKIQSGDVSPNSSITITVVSGFDREYDKHGDLYMVSEDWRIGIPKPIYSEVQF